MAKDGTLCHLYKNGVCTFLTDATSDVFARSDFKEYPRTDTGVCTHKYYV
jgi:hypothetical protein